MPMPLSMPMPYFMPLMGLLRPTMTIGTVLRCNALGRSKWERWSWWPRGSFPADLRGRARSCTPVQCTALKALQLSDFQLPQFMQSLHFVQSSHFLQL